jgi:hypothetical protein
MRDLGPYNRNSLLRLGDLHYSAWKVGRFVRRCVACRPTRGLLRPCGLGVAATHSWLCVRSDSVVSKTTAARRPAPCRIGWIGRSECLSWMNVCAGPVCSKSRSRTAPWCTHTIHTTSEPADTVHDSSTSPADNDFGPLVQSRARHRCGNVVILSARDARGPATDD